MGKALHDIVHETEGTACRIYAPVGAHRDLLAYLVRRLLENGANSSFVNQIVDETVPVDAVAADPFAAAERYLDAPQNPRIVPPPDLFAPDRTNAAGWDLADPIDVARFDAARAPYRDAGWRAAPVTAVAAPAPADAQTVFNPADPSDRVGTVIAADRALVEVAIGAARPWNAPVADRAAVLNRAADLYEAAAGEFFGLLAREAGKTPPDAVSELREAVDFLRYYAAGAQKNGSADAIGLVSCISPWNFPLAIFTGQIAAALAAGNAVLAKPAEQTPLIAHRAVELLLKAGVPPAALQFLPGPGGETGAALTSDPRIGAVCFTGSIDTARTINRAMARSLAPSAPFIAETGGINAMIVDSTALPEQAVRDIVASAFQSAGQRCSALRVLYVQEDIAGHLLAMLTGAMAELAVGDPWARSTDVGPVIDEAARRKIAAHIDGAAREGRVLKRCPDPDAGTFVGPAIIRVDGIGDLVEEIFGPVLHVATFPADGIDRAIDDINRTGYGLTFGLHTRIDDRVQRVVDRVRAGNIYVNRNQIGAVVGSQPFGGEGLSGTGPKAGGPFYLPRFARGERPEIEAQDGSPVSAAAVARSLSELASVRDGSLREIDMPGPTGESNRLSVFPRGVVLCLGPTAAAAQAQRDGCIAAGCSALAVAPGVTDGLNGTLPPEVLRGLDGFDAAIFWGRPAAASGYRQALAARTGPVVPLICEREFADRLALERHVCIDTTASGGNASLLAASDE